MTNRLTISHGNGASMAYAGPIPPGSDNLFGRPGTIPDKMNPHRSGPDSSPHIDDRMRRAAPDRPSADPRHGDQSFKAELASIIPDLRSFTRGLCGRPDMADELAQDAMLQAWTSRSIYPKGASLKAWIFAIARKRYYSGARKDETWVSWEPQPAGNEPSPLSPAEPGSIPLADVSRSLGKLPPEQREALLLVFANRMSYEEAAEVTGCAAQTVESRAAAGRQALALLIEAPATRKH